MKKTLLVVLAVLIVAAVVYGSIRIADQRKQETKEQKEQIAREVEQLDRIILDEHDCEKAVASAESIVARDNTQVSAWYIKGACEFDLGRFDSAKASFEKVLALEPEYGAAAKYLERMPKPGEVVVSPTKEQISREEFESRLGLNLDELELKSTHRRPASIPEYLEAVYTSARSFEQTVSYVRNVLEAAGHEPQYAENSESVVFAIFSGSEERLLIVSKDASPAEVKVNYLRHE